MCHCVLWIKMVSATVPCLHAAKGHCKKVRKAEIMNVINILTNIIVVAKV